MNKDLFARSGTARFAILVGCITLLWIALIALALMIGGTRPGRYLAYSGQLHSDWDTDLFLLDLEHAMMRNLTRTRFIRDADPMWSRDGSRLAFYRGNNGVCIMDIPGLRTDCLALNAFENGVMDVYIIGWLPGNTHLALYVTDTTALTYFTVIDVDSGSLLNQRWRGEAMGGLYNRIGALSPDGSTLMGIRIVNGLRELILAPIGDINAFITLSGDEFDANYPAWSPDGSLIAYVGYLSARGELFTVRADGSEAHIVASDVRNVLPGITWSPDGASVLFGSNMDGNDFELYAVNPLPSFNADRPASVNSLRVLTDNRELDERPQFSPDGEWIAYISAEDLRCGYGHVFLMRADGTDKRQITYGCGAYFAPVWQP